jgi:hypothetical protein
MLLIGLIALQFGSAPVERITAISSQSGSVLIGSGSTNIATNLVNGLIVETVSWVSDTNTPIFTMEPGPGWFISGLSTPAGATGSVVYAGAVTGQASVVVFTRNASRRWATVNWLDFSRVVSAGSNRTAVGWTNVSLNYAARTNLASYMDVPATWDNAAVYLNGAQNTNCWLYGVHGLRSMAKTSTYGATGCGSLVSPYHLVNARHAGGASTFTFTTTNGTTITRTNGASMAVDGTDIQVCVLTAPATDCEFVPVVGPSITNRLGGQRGIAGGNSFPLVFVQQNYRAMLTECSIDTMAQYSAGQTSPQSWSNSWSQWTFPVPNSGYSSQVQGGDSGTPIYFMLSNRLHLAGTWMTYNGFPFVAKFTNEIQQAMDALSDASGTPRQTLQVLDVSDYPTY